MDVPKMSSDAMQFKCLDILRRYAGKRDNRIRNQVKRLTRNITKNMKEDWLGMQRKTQKQYGDILTQNQKTKESIGNLLKDPSKLESEVAESDKEKAEVLADYFSSVFTNEPQGPTPT